jgi:CheY-like chemotaxis protein
MRQILINLVGNSAKFTEQGEIAVKVTWTAATGTLVLEVSDTGCGISEAKMSKLFDPFVQDISSRMRDAGGKNRGTGLGLPIVKRMVKSAKGTVTATSTLDKGTTFRIEISDLTVIEKLSAAPRTAEATICAAMPERVLVVDDVMMNRKILGIHLTNMKIKDIRYAENGEEAMGVMREWVPDLVLTDMWMPKMDGTQLAEAMRKERRLAEIPIVAVTADMDVGSSYDMSLFAKVITKPVTTDKLHALFGDIAPS